MNSKLIIRTVAMGGVLSLLSGCYKTIEVDLPQIDPLIVAESQSNVSENGIMNMSLTKTMRILDFTYKYVYIDGETYNPFDSITNASIKLYSDGALFTELTNPDGTSKYSSTKKLEEGKDYQVVVDCPNEGKQLKASFSYPKHPEIELISYQDTSSAWYDQTGLARVKITDMQPGVRNYFRVKVIERLTVTYTNPPQVLSSDRDISFNSRSSILSDVTGTDNSSVDVGGDNNMGEYFGQYAYFSDELLKGNNTSLEVMFYKQQDFENPPYYSSKTEYFVQAEAIPVELLLFLKTLTLQAYSNGDPFAQPTEVYTNFDNSLGVFALPAISRIQVK